MAFAAETHLHADFLTGAIELAATDGARIVASASGGRTFDHVGLRDGDEVDLGGLVLWAWETPGHTGEHLAYLLLDGNRVLGVFTGGSLIVGAAARTDLAGPEHTEPLALAQYHSLRRLMALPDETAIWPSHGAGSFCSASPGAERTSTIGKEKISNPLLQLGDEETFVRRFLDSLGSFPPYFRRLAEINRGGPGLVGRARLEPLSAVHVLALLGDGAVLVDVRPAAAFAARHIPGAISIPLRPQFASWLGWLLDLDTTIVIVRDRDQDADEIVWQALKIGYESMAGELAEPWPGDLETIPMIAPGQIGDQAVLDVRQDGEYVSGHIPGAVHVELGELPGAPVPDEPFVVMCGHGERAMTAASLLARTGHRRLRVLNGGPEDWAKATGRQLEQGA
ncbi:rhodanese-like domain-containing protein [Nonomuraea polychroma]|uniref:rhodanese-like domain-containing protein n=1 Tax=Nonomuraea polychroma TaxID=46176 RepID=UPI001F4D7B30|nr:rhodanese-like domain-containing protein [Nonomuraea polychroma]